MQTHQKLDNYLVPSEFTDEKIDKFGRRIIYNKYKVLDYMYKYPIVEDNVQENNIKETLDNI